MHFAMRFSGLRRGLPTLILTLAGGLALFGHRLGYRKVFAEWGFIALAVYLCMISLVLARQMRSKTQWLAAVGIPFVGILLIILPVISEKPHQVAPFVIIYGLTPLTIGWASIRPEAKPMRDLDGSDAEDTPWYLKASVPVGLLAASLAGGLIEVLSIPPVSRGEVYMESLQQVRALPIVSKLTFASSSPEWQLTILVLMAFVAFCLSLRYAFKTWPVWILVATTIENGRMWFALTPARWTLSMDDIAWIRYEGLLWRLEVRLWLTGACFAVSMLWSLARKRTNAAKDNISDPTAPR